MRGIIGEWKIEEISRFAVFMKYPCQIDELYWRARTGLTFINMHELWRGAFRKREITQHRVSQLISHHMNENWNWTTTMTLGGVEWEEIGSKGIANELQLLNVQPAQSTHPRECNCCNRKSREVRVIKKLWVLRGENKRGEKVKQSGTGLGNVRTNKMSALCR